MLRQTTFGYVLLPLKYDDDDLNTQCLHPLVQRGMERQTVDNRRSSRLLLPSFTLVDFPMELLVYIISFVTSSRDRVKLCYVSQRLRAAMETPSLWREFTWPNFDCREEQSIMNVLKSCGRHVKRLSFPNLVIPVESLHHCDNVLRLSLPSVKLSLDQLKTVMQCMKKLQYLDILWMSKNDIKHLLMMVGYPDTIKELIIRERVKDSSFDEALHFLLNEWTALRLLPHTINIVSCVYPILIAKVLDKWLDSGISRPTDHIGHLNIYRSFNAVLVPPPPSLQYQISGPHCLKLLFVNASNYGLLGLKSDQILLTSRTISNTDVIHKGSDVIHKGSDVIHKGSDVIHKGSDVIHKGSDVIHKGSDVIHKGSDVIHKGSDVIHKGSDVIHKGSDVIHKGTIRNTNLQNAIHAIPLKIDDIKFMTHFSATECDFFYSGHLEQLAIACPNLQQLNLRKNVNCFKNLQGLRAIAAGCQRLEGLYIALIPVDNVESLVQLWEVLADLQLTYLSIDLCCLLEDTKAKRIIIGLHQKCLKLKALESHRIDGCRKCHENDQLLQLSNFPLLIHLVIEYIDVNNICETL